MGDAVGHHLLDRNGEISEKNSQQMKTKTPIKNSPQQKEIEEQEQN